MFIADDDDDWNRENEKSRTTAKLPGLMQYLHTSLLENRAYIKWIDEEKGLFKITEPKDIAKNWGCRADHKEGRRAADPNTDLKYEHFSRALR